MWEVWSVAQSMHCRPSDLLGIRDPLVAFYTDRASFTLASTIESAMDQAEKRLPNSAKEAAHTRARQRVLDQYLGFDAVDLPERFRAPGK